MQVYARDFPVERKDDHSPLTEADMASHHLIVAGLSALEPMLPVLSEESAAIAWDIRRQWRRYWLVDPLDGTREFIKKNGEFTVNIALVDAGVAVFGVIYAPALDELLLERLELVPVSSERLLLVFNLRSGVLRTIFVEVPGVVPAPSVQQVSGILNERLSGLIVSLQQLDYQHV